MSQKKINEVDLNNEEKKCDFEDCPTFNSNRVGIIVSNQNGEFPEMKEGQWMHIECYIRHCVKKALKELN